MTVNAKRSLLIVGQNVVVCPTKEDQAVDRRNKYYLGLNIGKILAINQELQQVQLWWYHGKRWKDDSWILWVDPKSNEPYKQWMPVDDLAVDDIGRIIRVTMEPSCRRRRHNHFKLSSVSVKTINQCIKLNLSLLNSDSTSPSHDECSEQDSSDSE
jgi:hypothetical protein